MRCHEQANLGRARQRERIERRAHGYAASRSQSNLSLYGNLERDAL